MKKSSLSFIVKLLLLLISTHLSAADRELVLENVQWTGSQRVDRQYFEEELGLKANATFSLSQLERVQSRLLSTGLFRSARLFLERSNRPGHASLNIELEDDPSVLGPWALGGKLGLTQSQVSSRTLGNELNPIGVKAQLVSRNLWGKLHRALAEVDLNQAGQIQAFQAIYGLPRFSEENNQFDASFEGVKPNERYLEALGFGLKAQATWTLGPLLGPQYVGGVAFYSNQNESYVFPGERRTVLGPKFGIQKETRLLQFRPSEGYRLAASVVATSAGIRAMSFETEGALTQDLGSWAAWTAESQILSVGLASVHMRHRLRLESSIPLWNEPQDPLVYLEGVHGYDRGENLKLEGRQIRLGLRLHSNGLIADIAFSVKTLPDWFDRVELKEPRL